MIWLELEIRGHGEQVRVSARGCRGERAREQELGGGFTAPRLAGFRVAVGNAIARVQPLEGEALEEARALHEALLAGEVRDLYVRLAALASDQKQRLLVRLMIEDPNLQAIPWEAVCRPQTARGFLAAAADVFVTRGVNSVDPWQPRELRRALVVLPVLAIPDRPALESLQLVLKEHVESGAVELLPAIEGDAARNPVLFERLRAGPSPHVLHFLGHGGFDAQRNPVIRLADDADGERTLLPIEVFAEELRANFDTMRLVYLQACSGARPGVFASAAELLARSGVDAVVAHLWPVRAEVARAAAQDFYGHLIGARAGGGDVGAAMQASRRTLLAASADGFSPVLYLRGPDARLFDLEERRLRPPKPGRAAAGPGELPAPLRALLQGPFSLVLGEAWDDEATREVQARLREGLLEALKLSEAGEAPTPLHSLAQRYALQAGRLKLDRLFQKTLLAVHSRHDAPAIIDGLAPHLRPGVHTTLLWLPLLEHAIVRHHPDRPLYVVQPGPPGHEDRRLVMVRAPGGDEWEEVEALPRLKLDEAFVVLRLYGGYSPEAQPMLMSPQLTEDDHIQGLFELRYIVPPEWDNMIMGWLRTRPALCVGISALDWRHRMLLRWLFDQRPPPAGSLAILGDDQQEAEIWEKRGAGLPGTGHFAVVREPAAALIDALREARP
ncbi:MAG: CHAT domain-containing protein [Myxococcales bacterium]|nr:CHAT domain-containing protein [Myxococcales bacterium]